MIVYPDFKHRPETLPANVTLGKKIDIKHTNKKQSKNFLLIIINFQEDLSLCRNHLVIHSYQVFLCKNLFGLFFFVLC